MGAPSGGSSGVVWFLGLLSTSVGVLPECAMAPLGGVLGWLWWRVFRFRRTTVRQNLALAFPDTTDRERDSLALEATRHLSRTLLEVLRLPHYARSKFERVDVCGMEHLTHALRSGRGVLVFSGHLGSFELAMAAGAQQAPAPVSVVVKGFSAATQAFMTRVRSAAGLHVIDERFAMGPVRAALARNEIVVFVLDQNATRRRGVFVEFFGKAACTLRALAVVALRTGAPVVPVIARRDPDGRHRLTLGPPIPFESRGSMHASVREMTQVYTSYLEGAIREAPAQWFWSHRRWKTRPISKVNTPGAGAAVF